MTDGTGAGGSGEPRFAASVAKLPQDGAVLAFAATPEECAAVARRFNILAVSRFTAELRLSRWSGEGVVAEGELAADVEQSDVVTLEPVPQAIREPVRFTFVPEGSRLVTPEPEPGAELEVGLADDAPETFRGDRIDLAEPLIQTLGVALDPYPRRAGTVFEPAPDADARQASPFAVLANLGKPKD